ncbi:restriction endonuclease [Streptomyces sp. NPDC048331]|uniref:restriction endonuclease n=1 Tax=Streptomyces sp. NPDC048331 TaxID=3365534 RepID=UPI00371FA2FF
MGGANDLGAHVVGHLPHGRKLVVQCKRYAKYRTVGSPDLQKFNGTARSEHGADVPLFVASCKFTEQARSFAARHGLVLVDVALLGFWNTGRRSPAGSDVSRGDHERGCGRPSAPVKVALDGGRLAGESAAISKKYRPATAPHPA